MENAIISQHALGPTWETEDPFLFCAYHRDIYPAGDEQLGLKEEHKAGRMIGQDFQMLNGFRMYHGSHVPGFPAHPHAGFETITIVRQGFVDHADSLGAAARFGQGDVQWMTAGRGIQHSEMFPLLSQVDDNPLELFQIWLNLPEQNRQPDPYFKMIWSEDIPRFTIVDGRGRSTELELIAGEWNGERAVVAPPDSWAARNENALAIWHIRMEPGAELELPIAESELNRQLFLYQGNEIHINGVALKRERSARLYPHVKTSIKNGNKEARILMLQARPISQRSVQHGPFVAASREGLIDTMQRFQSGEFGNWPWPDSEPVHDHDSGRFARYPDGVVVKP